MKIQKPLPGMTPEETERQLQYMNAVIMFKVMYSRGIINEKEVENLKHKKEKLENALQVVDRIIEKGTLDRKDIEILMHYLLLVKRN